jgi:outer membrane lipoprotein-sorting protein
MGKEVRVVTFVVAMWVALAQEPPTAEQLVARMQEALTKAKTVQFSFSAELDGGDDKEFNGKMEGTIWLAQGNKMRLEIKLPERSVTLVSDGKSIGGTRDGKLHDKTSETPASLNAHLIHALCQGGLMVGVLPWLNHIDRLEGDKDAGVSASAFKLGAKEGATQSVEFEIAKDGEEKKLKATLWVDEKTGLPAKVLVPDSGSGGLGRNLKITETFTGFKLDADIDAEKFKVPK